VLSALVRASAPGSLQLSLPCWHGVQGEGAGARDGGPQITEAAYVRLWENYCHMTGRPFSVDTVRGWYHDYQSRLAGRRG